MGSLANHLLGHIQDTRQLLTQFHDLLRVPGLLSVISAWRLLEEGLVELFSFLVDAVHKACNRFELLLYWGKIICRYNLGHMILKIF